MQQLNFTVAKFLEYNGIKTMHCNKLNEIKFLSLLEVGTIYKFNQNFEVHLKGMKGMEEKSMIC